MVELLVDAARVLFALPRIELARRYEGPAPLLQRLRREGRQRSRRSDEGRRRLRKAILALDRRLPGGGNCYRRALLEIALDPDAAQQPFVMGFSSSCAPKSGHAWVGSDVDSSRLYEATISL